MAGVSITSTSVGVGVGVSTEGQEDAIVVGGDGAGIVIVGIKKAGLSVVLLRPEAVNLDGTGGVAGASEVALTSHRSARR